MAEFERHKDWRVQSKDGRVTILYNMTRGEAVVYSLKVMNEPDSRVEPANVERNE